MSKELDKNLDKLLAEQSSELLEGLQNGGESERRKLAEWLTQSKRHVRTHLFMTALEEELRRVDPEREMEIPEVRAEAPAIFPRAFPAARGERKGWVWALAAAVLLTVLAGSQYPPAVDYLFGWRAFETGVGEQRSVSLSDGSIVQLNTATRIQTRVSKESRDIRLLNGEALFKVAPDRSRPFQVKAGNVAILAVGTQFNVYQVDGRTKVSVLEGRVRVAAAADKPSGAPAPALPTALIHASAPALTSAPILAAGQEVEVSGDGRAVQRASPDVANAAAWVQRRVVFKQEPLANVVAQFNRYRKSPQLRIADPALAARQYSGTFDVDDPSSFQDVLSNERDVVLERTGDEIVIRAR